MTQEEYQREQEEIQRLINEINWLVHENNILVSEVNEALHNIGVLQNRIVDMNNSVTPRVRGLSGKVEINSEQTQMVSNAIADVSSRYFTFKTLSTASKNLTQYTEEYYSKFADYNHLRRITLGYVIGLNSEFASRENLRKTVEKAYLQNTEYWLAYATMAMMLWASDEEEAAKRALEKAMFISPEKASLFFMLINLRFSRLEAAQKWFVNYMDRVNPSDLGDEWKYLLQAYLSGAFGVDARFQEEVSKMLRKMTVQSEALTVDFNKRFIDSAYTYADSYLHQTKAHFSYLKGLCPDYELLMDMLSSAEKNSILAQYYEALLNEEDEKGENIYQRIENVLYSLISDYDDDELDVVKKIKYNEHIMSAQGDTAAAQKKLDSEFGIKKDRNFADLLSEWAFAEDNKITPLSIRRFSISCMQEWIFKGYEKYAKSHQEKEKNVYDFNVDGCHIQCSENDLAMGQNQIHTYYEKGKWKTMMADKFVLIYSLIAFVGILTLGVLVIQLFNGAFSPIALIAGILLLALGAFLLWRQVVFVLEQLRERERLNMQRFHHALQELAEWRKLYHTELGNLKNLQEALSQFGSSES